MKMQVSKELNIMGLINAFYEILLFVVRFIQNQEVD